MIIEEFVDIMKNIQNALLDFFDEELDDEDKYNNFMKLIETHKISNDRYSFKELLRLINNIGNNHHRVPSFISKFERLLRFFKKDIEKYFSNSELFEIFKNNKRILLLLIEEQMMTIDEYIFSIITRNEYVYKRYCEYFQPEIKPLLTKENIEKYSETSEVLKYDDFIEMMNKEVDEDFYEKRKEGEDDDYLCKLIRFDKIKEFATFVNQTNMSLESEIKYSIFETNQLLIEESDITLIEYAAFFGSFKIVQYIIEKVEKLNPELWIYAVHCKDARMIHLLEENQIKLYSQKVLKESIKCHHNDISQYIIDNLIKEEDLQKDIENNYNNNLYQYAVESHNYCFFPSNMKYKNMFNYLFEFDYPMLAKLYLEEGNIELDTLI
ncbi:hypothetical protein M9Y10_045065 [Tritrichomonas musculus]|uniref:DUF3447 domain-containing protein n=1 Tax=Tritrichomonas musculus TaxID=1915356 RepID=A0ABR2JVE2_9EUKA